MTDYEMDFYNQLSEKKDKQIEEFKNLINSKSAPERL